MSRKNARLLNYAVIFAFAIGGTFLGILVGSLGFNQIPNPTRDEFIRAMIGTPFAGFALMGAVGIIAGSWLEEYLKYKI